MWLIAEDCSERNATYVPGILVVGERTMVLESKMGKHFSLERNDGEILPTKRKKRIPGEMDDVVLDDGQSNPFAFRWLISTAVKRRVERDI